MLELIRQNKLGFEMVTVLWSNVQGEFQAKDFWSERFAKEFIARKFKHIDLDTVKIKELNND